LVVTVFDMLGSGINTMQIKFKLHAATSVLTGGWLHRVNLKITQHNTHNSQIMSNDITAQQGI